jgi:methionyl-tRNA formyltransferase
MQSERYVVCAYRDWNIRLFNEKLSCIGNFTLISKKQDLTKESLEKINPKIVFFLDWSWIVSDDIISNFFCVGFHSAPLPEFRGGSPIQNQIIRGVKDTKLSAFKMDGGIDTGNILAQKDLSLEGHLSDIFSSISDLSFSMIIDIVNGNYTETKQIGDGSYYKRRKPKDSELQIDDMSSSIGYLNDFIRMLEDPYPNAFIIIKDKKIIFKSSEIKDGKINAKIIIEEAENA